MILLEAIAARLAPWRRRLLLTFVLALVLGVPFSLGLRVILPVGGISAVCAVGAILLLTWSLGLFTFSWLYDSGTGMLALATIRPSAGHAKLNGYMWRYLALVVLVAWFAVPVVVFRALADPAGWLISMGSRRPLVVERTLANITDNVWDIEFSPDGSKIAVGTVLGHVTVYSAGSGTLLTSFGCSRGCYSIEFSSDGTRLLASGGDGVVLYDVRNKKLLRVFNGTEGCFLDEGRKVWTGGNANFAIASGPMFYRCWDTTTGERVEPPEVWGVCAPNNLSSTDLLKPEGFLHDIPGWRWGRLEAPTWANVRRRLDRGGLQSAAIALVAGDSESRELRIARWESKDEHIRVDLPMKTNEMSHGASFSLDCSVLGVLVLEEHSEDKYTSTLHFVDSRTGSRLSSHAFDHGCVDILHISPDNRLAAIAVAPSPRADDVDLTILLVIDVATGRVLQKETVHTDGIRAIAWSPDGKTLATGGMDQSALVWRRVRRFGH